MQHSPCLRQGRGDGGRHSPHAPQRTFHRVRCAGRTGQRQHKRADAAGSGIGVGSYAQQDCPKLAGDAAQRRAPSSKRPRQRSPTRLHRAKSGGHAVQHACQRRESRPQVGHKLRRVACPHEFPNRCDQPAQRFRRRLRPAGQGGQKIVEVVAVRRRQLQVLRQRPQPSADAAHIKGHERGNARRHQAQRREQRTQRRAQDAHNRRQRRCDLERHAQAHEQWAERGCNRGDDDPQPQQLRIVLGQVGDGVANALDKRNRARRRVLEVERLADGVADVDRGKRDVIAQCRKQAGQRLALRLHQPVELAALAGEIPKRGLQFGEADLARLDHAADLRLRDAHRFGQRLDDGHATAGKLVDVGGEQPALHA